MAPFRVTWNLKSDNGPAPRVRQCRDVKAADFDGSWPPKTSTLKYTCKSIRTDDLLRGSRLCVGLVTSASGLGANPFEGMPPIWPLYNKRA